MRTRLTNESVPTMSKTAAKKSTSGKRELSGAPEYNKDNVTQIVNMLSQVSAALETSKKAVEELTSVASDEFSPDGMLGGRGYVMAIRDMKTELAETVTSLSSVRDTLADELNNPGWGLSKDEKESITKVQEDSGDKAQENLEDISKEIEQIFGADEVTEDSEEEAETETDIAEKDDGEVEDVSEETGEGAEAFPDFKEEDSEESEEEAPKFASSSNMPFVGLGGNADGVTKKLASSVLSGLVASCTESTK